MKTNIHFKSYLARFFLEWEMLRTEFLKKIKTHIPYSITLFRKSCLCETVWKKCGRVGQATDDNMAHTHFMLDTQGYKHILRICNTYCFSIIIMVGWTRFSVMLYVNCQSYLIFTYTSHNKSSTNFTIFALLCVFYLQQIDIFSSNNNFIVLRNV